MTSIGKSTKYNSTASIYRSSSVIKVLVLVAMLSSWEKRLQLHITLLILQFSINFNHSSEILSKFEKKRKFWETSLPCARLRLTYHNKFDIVNLEEGQELMDSLHKKIWKIQKSLIIVTRGINFDKGIYITATIADNCWVEKCGYFAYGNKYCNEFTPSQTHHVIRPIYEDSTIDNINNASYSSMDLISVPWSFRCSCSEPYGTCWRKHDSCALISSRVFGTNVTSYNQDGCAYIFSEPECGTCENGYTIVGVGETIIRKEFSTAVLMVDTMCRFVSGSVTSQFGIIYQYVANGGSYDAETSPILNVTGIVWTCVCGHTPAEILLPNATIKILSSIIFNETFSTTDVTSYEETSGMYDAVLTDNSDSSSTTVVILVGAVIATILFVSTLAVVIVVYRIHRSNAQKYKSETEKVKEIIESTRRRTMKNFESEYPLLVPFFNFTWNQEFGNWIPSLKHYEVPRNRFSFEEGDWPKSGRFGKVYKGSLKKEDGLIEPVAVKTDSRGRYYKRSLLYEMVVFSVLGKHPNIVNFLGACTSNIYHDELFLLMEYCTNGSLRSYLIVHGEKFENYVRGNDEVRPPPGSDIDKLLEDGVLNTLHLMKWALQVAKGLVHLCEKKIVHNDLAARNILLDDMRNAKIADYGLSRSLEEPSPVGYKKSTVANLQYIKEFEEPLPPLLAPESRARNEFSFQTDVWSFGNLLYEIFTLGDDPIRTHQVNHKPRWSTGRIHLQIIGCLQSDASKRPLIHDLDHFLEKELLQLRQTCLRSSQAIIGEEDGQISEAIETLGFACVNSTSDEIIPKASKLELNNVGYVITQNIGPSIVYLPNSVAEESCSIQETLSTLTTHHTVC